LRERCKEKKRSIKFIVCKIECREKMAEIQVLKKKIYS